MKQNLMTSRAPVITIDGPSGAGKGTISQLLAQSLGWHYLDSGAIYRVLGHVVGQNSLTIDDVSGLVQLAQSLDVEFRVTPESDQKLTVFSQQKDITSQIRTVEAGQMASKVSALPEVRAALLTRQHDFRQLPGLVTDGRDMGTVVFPDADVKIFLTASAEERARRRQLQLQQKGIDASIQSILEQIQQRDQRDRQRETAPLVKAVDALEINTDGMEVSEVLAEVKATVAAKGIC